MYQFEIEAPYFFPGNRIPGLIPDPRSVPARIEYERLLRLFERWKPDFATDGDRDGSA
jgi:hypothetical protein